MKLLLSIFLASILAAYFCANACPDAVSMTKLLGGRACGFLYEHESCNGKRLDLGISSNSLNLKNEGFNDKASSAQVRPGCTLKVFQHRNYGGKNGIWGYWEGGHRNLRDNGLHDKISSYDCFCEEWVLCKPQDTLIEVGRCEAPTGVKNPINCTVIFEQGVFDTKSEAYGSSTTQTLSASVGAVLSDIFSFSSSLSSEWKSWQETSLTHSFSKGEKFQMQIVAEPGETIIIGQRRASCGRYMVTTNYEMFSGKLGNKISRTRRLNSKIQVAKL